ncbi:MAG: aldo/keto reductase [Anaerolineae bacterium]|jgi:predicted aldo/keto reductase-like oxidoreductase
MITTRLGKTGLEVSRVGIGGIPIQRPSEDEAIKIIHRALDLGINFIDTAAGYGNSEERIGKALIGHRDQVVIATKSGRPGKTEAAAELERSLKRLQTDVIDIWQLHNISNAEKYAQVTGPGGSLETAQEALQAGKIRHIGLSSHNLDIAIKAVKSGLFEVIQFPFNYVTREPEDELIPLAKEYDVGFIGMKPFAGGMLGNATLSIKYVLQFTWVVPDPGIQKVEEIEEIVAIVESGDWDLTPQERQEIEARRAELGTQFCRQCGYCQPCPEDVNIPMVMITQGMWKLWPRDTFLRWMGEVADGARNCIECGECETKCPYQLPIREMIAENIAFYERVSQS